MMTQVQRILSQWVIGYNFTSNYTETVVASACLMSDGTQQTQYDGHRTDNQSNMTAIHEYGERCPLVEWAQKAQ